MTNKQYEHLGRALMLASDLAQGVENLYETRKSLEEEIGRLVGADAAKQIVTAMMGETFPAMHLGRTLMSIANSVAEVTNNG